MNKAISKKQAKELFNAVFVENTAPTGEHLEGTVFLETCGGRGIVIVQDGDMYQIWNFNIIFDLGSYAYQNGYAYRLEYNELDEPDTMVSKEVALAFIEAYGQRVIYWGDVHESTDYLRLAYDFYKL